MKMVKKENVMDKKLIIVIDFNNTVFKGYYKEKLINSKGENVNAVKSFFFKLGSLKNNLNPDYIIFAADANRETTFRKKIFKDYKANRDRRPHDPDISTQIRYAQTLAQATGYPFLSNDEYEADDIMGMISKWSTDNDMNTILISSDKDLYQLLNDNTYIMRGAGDTITDEHLNMNYKLTPSQWIELKILMGDRGDNIPGVDGIGEVTALRMLHQFGTVDEIYKNINSFKDGIKDKLISAQDSIPLMRELVTIVTDYTKLNISEETLIRKQIQHSRVFELLNELELPSLNNIMRYSILQE